MFREIRPYTWRAHRALPALLWTALASSGGCVLEPADAGVFEAAVQQETSTRYSIQRSSMLRGTGVIEYWDQFVESDGDTLEAASCGVTFISPHFAVTAAHCVPHGVRVGGLGGTVERPQFVVWEMNTTGLDTAQASSLGTVSGTWPGWTSPSINDYPAGYDLIPQICRVKCRGSYNAPGSSAMLCNTATTGRDIALIECPAREATRFWSQFDDDDDALGQQVDTFWYHEFLALPFGFLNHERWTRYQGYGSMPGLDHSENFHYAAHHRFYPLVSQNRADGTPAIVRSSPSGAFPRADLFGCHGTSGSGVFARGSTYLRGPVTAGEFSGLCGDGFGWLQVSVARTLETLSYVVADRG